MGVKQINWLPFRWVGDGDNMTTKKGGLTAPVMEAVVLTKNATTVTGGALLFLPTTSQAFNADFIWRRPPPRSFRKRAKKKGVRKRVLFANFETRKLEKGRAAPNKQRFATFNHNQEGNLFEEGTDIGMCANGFRKSLFSPVLPDLEAQGSEG